MAEKNQFKNPYSTYDPNTNSGKMAGFSNPVYGEGAIYKSPENVAKWATGGIMMDDLNPMVDPNYNLYQGSAYDPNAGNLQLGDAWSQQYGSAAQAFQGRGGPAMQGATIASAPQGEWRTQQQGLVDVLGRRIAGDSPSVAEMQLQESTGRNIKAAKALAAGSTDPGLASRNASQAMTQANVAGNMQAAQLRAGEQQAAEQALGGVLGQGRSQDIGVATSQAGFDQGANQANLQANLQQQQMNDQMTRFYEEMGYSRDQAQLMANIELEKMRQQEAARVDQMNADIAKQNVEAEQASQGGILGAAGEVLGGIVGMFSDERLKEDVAPAGEDIDDFMKSLDAVSYDYLGREDLPKGRQYGILAQDLEKSKVGKSFVVDTPKGKFVDVGRGYGAVLAALRRLDERLSGVEGAKAGAV